MKLEVREDIMAVNNRHAAANRKLFAEKGVFAVNIIGSPGAGKTALVERLIEIMPELNIAVIEGDLATARDAARIAAKGAKVTQINTDGGCHLDAAMIDRVLPLFDLDDTDILIIENVGNLVCPTGFDLGEGLRLVLLSVAEGGDKPVKYPATFIAADAVVLNKLDMLELTDFDMEQARADLLGLKPGLIIFETVCRPGHQRGVEELAAYLRQRAAGEKN